VDTWPADEDRRALVGANPALEAPVARFVAAVLRLDTALLERAALALVVRDRVALPLLLRVAVLRAALAAPFEDPTTP